MQVEKLGHKLLITFLAVATVAGQLYNEWLEVLAVVFGGHLSNFGGGGSGRRTFAQ